jgi:catechol 2,3-dioxygenase-like lactoylglutathione lyase family enzyme
MTLREPEYGGINHLALVCSDMARTVSFYRDTLGMPLVKTIELPGGMGQHFFFDCGGGDCLAFFWFPNAPESQPGVASASALPGLGDLETAIGSMNHVAFSVPRERIEELRDQLREHGIECTPVYNHDNSPEGIAREVTDDVFVRSVYFFDPDGILLEFACWTKPLGAEDVRHEPATALSRSTAPA